MNQKSTIEQLRSIADILEDESYLYINNALIDGITRMELVFFMDTGEIIQSPIGEHCTVSNFKQRKFSEAETVILENLPENLEYIARDELNNLWLFDAEPYKCGSGWLKNGVYKVPFGAFRDLFQTIQFEDDEACEFREFI